MKKYFPLFFIICSILLVVIGLNLFWLRSSDKDDKKIVMPSARITVYTTLPVEEVAPIASEYEKLNKVKVNFVILSQQELCNKISSPSKPLNGRGDLLLTDRNLLELAEKKEILNTYSSEQEDVISPNLKSKKDMWVGVWYDPIVFCINRDFMKMSTNVPYTWTALAKTPNIKIGMTDFLASNTASQLFYSLIEAYGIKKTFILLKEIHPKVVQYAKYLSTPVRMAGMGDSDISIALQSEAIRYYNNGYPLAIIVPEDGTYFDLTGVGLLKNAPNVSEAGRFMQWLLGDDVQLCLEDNAFFFIPTNATTLAYKNFAVKQFKIFNTDKITLTTKQKAKLMDDWVKNIRLN